MVKKGTKKRPARGEMELLRVLWDTGGATISQAHQAMPREVGYTTVQTRLNRMVENGLATRSQSRPAEYRAAIDPEEVSAGQLEELLQRITKGEVVPLVAQLVGNRQLDRDEIRDLKRLIRAAEQRAKQEEA